MITEIRHSGIVVQNLKKSLNFFVKDLGFSIFKKMNEKGKFIDKILNLKNANVLTIKLKTSRGSVIELLKFYNYPHKKKWQGKIFHTGLTHISLTVKDINKIYNKLNVKYKFTCKPEVSVDGKAKVTFLKGPENLFIELVEIL
jgi:catechol-2,3-dioxygenase